MSTLIETLKHIEKRPGMYFGDPKRARSIHIVRAFILGFQTAQLAAGSDSDLDCFTEWVATHYHVLADARGGFDMILEHVGGDEGEAFDEFFRLLPEYARERQQLDRKAIISRFDEVQEECLKEFRKETEKQ